MKNIISKYINVAKPRRMLDESDEMNISSKEFYGHTVQDDYNEYGGPVGLDRFYQRALDFGVDNEAFEMYGSRSESSIMKVVRQAYKEYKKCFKLNESDSFDGDIKVYMNTWKNYNEYGADLEMYGIKDGWMSLDDAIEFAEKYAEDEPFINDIENSPIEISEYDSIGKLQELKEYEDCDDKEVVKAILQSGHTDDISEAISIAKSGDYLWFPGVETDAELAEAYIDMCGGIMEAVGDNVNDYLDKQSYRDDIEDDVAHLYMQDNDLESIDDCYNEENEEDFNAFLDAVVDEDIVNGDLSNYFDYDAFGSELGYDFTFVDDGAIRIY